VIFAEADPDHHRVDTTVLGDSDAMRRSALEAAAVALERIDIFAHHGGHPRMGAADVVPFVPVRDVGMDERVRSAREVGRELAESLGVPVYMYGTAALTPDRRSLAEVRRGEFEGLRQVR
jgi:glutamate formiminotransferase